MFKGSKYFWEIAGFTKAEKRVSIYRCSSFEQALKAFIEKYPRFRGEANILKCRYNILSDGLYSSTRDYQVINHFDSTKQIKEWI